MKRKAHERKAENVDERKSAAKTASPAQHVSHQKQAVEVDVTGKAPEQLRKLAHGGRPASNPVNGMSPQVSAAERSRNWWASMTKEEREELGRKIREGRQKRFGERRSTG